jgi:hypothetical protein
MNGGFQPDAYQQNFTFQSVVGSVVAAVSEWIVRARRRGRR